MSGGCAVSETPLGKHPNIPVLKYRHSRELRFFFFVPIIYLIIYSALIYTHVRIIPSLIHDASCHFFSHHNLLISIKALLWLVLLGALRKHISTFATTSFKLLKWFLKKSMFWLWFFSCCLFCCFGQGLFFGDEWQRCSGATDTQVYWSCDGREVTHVL